MNSNVGKVFKRTSHVVLPLDREKFDAFIDSKKSPATKKNVSQNCYYGFSFFANNYPEIMSVLKITPEQFKSYLTFIENRTLRKPVKRKYRSNLKAFINYLLDEARAYNEKIPFNYDYIFSDKFVKFTDSTDKVERDELTQGDVVEIISFFENRNFRDFIMVSLLAYSGCRVGGLCALKIEKIDLANRTFETQEKPTGNKTGWNRYFFPRKFKIHLESYILQVKRLNPSQELLFPIQTKTVRRQLSTYSKRHVNPHLFRDALNTNWVENGLLDSGIRSILLNQTPSGINATHYLKKYTQSDKSGKKRQKLYDQYFPY